MTTEEYILNELKRYLHSKNLSEIPLSLQKPKEAHFGDYASNLAMQLAGRLKQNPKAIAEDICQFITLDVQYISHVEIAGAGFINFFAASENLYQQLGQLLERGPEYGRSSSARGKRANVEFVSANPTGPLTIGHGRQAVLGDTIANLLQAIGYEVTREYYFNNAGRQMRILGNSVRLRYMELLGHTIDFPDDHYQGEYIIDIAQMLIDQYRDSLLKSDEINVFKETAERAIFENIKNTIKRLGFTFDVFSNENTLYENGSIDEVIRRLGEKGFTAERDGATWFLTSKLGFDQDRVLIKSSGEPTYRLPDIAYHVDKVKRGFDLIVDIFGADHIATYPDVLAGIRVLGYDNSKIEVLIHQFVTLTEDGEKVKMSTRKANFVTLDELIDEVGPDVTRYFFLMRQMNAHLNFDLTLAKTQSDENPVFYIQYAHARICSILALALSKSITIGKEPDLTLLNRDEELNLIKHLIDFPGTVEGSASSYEPHRLTNYLFDLATLFHKFYTEHRVISDDLHLTQARLALIKATQIVVTNGLTMLGISAPQQM